MEEQKKKVLLLDDESTVLDSHAAIFGMLPGYEIVTETSSIRAVSYLKNNPVDLLVFDVQMDGLNGMEMIQLLNPRPKLLMVTGYDEYIVPGFLDRVDFCLKKPLKVPELMTALSLIYKDEASSSKVLRPKFLIKEKETNSEFLVDLDEVSVVQSNKNYVDIYHVDGSMHTQRIQLKDIYDALPKDRFVQVERRYIININNLISRNNKSHKIQMRGYPLDIKVQDDHKDAFFALYNCFQ